MENKSQVLLKAGDRVLTSKGNIGEVLNMQVSFISEKAMRWNLWNYHDKPIWYLDCQSVIPNYYHLKTLDGKLTNDHRNGYELGIDINVTPLVKMGNKSYLIDSNQLTKLDTLFPVRVIWTADLTGMERDNETVVYLPKDFCLLCNGDKSGGNNLYSRIIPFLQSQVGVRDYITIFKIYAL